MTLRSCLTSLRDLNHSLAIFAFPALAAPVPRVAVSFCVLEVQQLLLK